MKTLWAIYLGGRYGDGFIEDHEIVFVVAQDKDEAKKLAKIKSKIVNDVHCDGVISISNVDGYDIEIKPSNNSEKVEHDNSYSKL